MQLIITSGLPNFLHGLRSTFVQAVLLKHVTSLRLVESIAFVEAVLKHTKEEAIDQTCLNNIVMAERDFSMTSSFVL